MCLFSPESRGNSPWLLPEPRSSCAITPITPFEINHVVRSKSKSDSGSSTKLAKGSPAAILMDRLNNKTATIGVVGLGYVGLPLAKAIFDAGYKVLGYDLDSSKIEKLHRGENYMFHLGDLVTPLSKSGRFQATDKPRLLAEADMIILCVPTPLGPHNEPDLSFVLDSTKMVASVLRKGQLIVLESTTYPGTTRKDMQPILEATGLVCGEDFFLAYSPEREDPGRKDTSTATIPKLVGGVDDVSTDLAMRTSIAASTSRW
jgi:UDP-N-acetyl-D-glucosamine dehydrogenase